MFPSQKPKHEFIQSVHVNIYMHEQLCLVLWKANVYVQYLKGCGLGLVFLTAVVIVTQHFHKYRSLASGIALSGCGCGAFVFR